MTVTSSRLVAKFVTTSLIVLLGALNRSEGNKIHDPSPCWSNDTVRRQLFIKDCLKRFTFLKTEIICLYNAYNNDIITVCTLCMIDNLPYRQ